MKNFDTSNMEKQLEQLKQSLESLNNQFSDLGQGKQDKILENLQEVFEHPIFNIDYYAKMFFICLMALLVIIFFGYKLIKSLLDKEKKKEEKRKLKQQKKKK